MVGKIFINYRRGDDPGYTQALYQLLEDEFTKANLFLDVEGYIHPGDDFVDILNEQVAAADILLAVIGPRWAELLATRVSDQDDFVQIEIRSALEKRKRVIPILVGGANMPCSDILPEAILPLARRNAIELRPQRFKTDCQGLIKAINEYLAAVKYGEEMAADYCEGQTRELHESIKTENSQIYERRWLPEAGEINTLIFDKGFGFIKIDGWGNKDLFFHSREVMGLATFGDLRAGDRMIFEVAGGRKGMFLVRVTKAV